MDVDWDMPDAPPLMEDAIDDGSMDWEPTPNTPQAARSSACCNGNNLPHKPPTVAGFAETSTACQNAESAAADPLLKRSSNKTMPPAGSKANVATPTFLNMTASTASAPTPPPVSMQASSRTAPVRVSTNKTMPPARKSVNLATPNMLNIISESWAIPLPPSASMQASPTTTPIRASTNKTMPPSGGRVNHVGSGLVNVLYAG